MVYLQDWYRCLPWDCGKTTYFIFFINQGQVATNASSSKQYLHLAISSSAVAFTSGKAQKVRNVYNMEQYSENQNRTRLEQPEVHFFSPQGRQRRHKDLYSAEHVAHDDQTDHGEDSNRDSRLIDVHLDATLEKLKKADKTKIQDELEDQASFDESQTGLDRAVSSVRVEVGRSALCRA